MPSGTLCPLLPAPATRVGAGVAVLTPAAAATADVAALLPAAPSAAACAAANVLCLKGSGRFISRLLASPTDSVRRPSWRTEQRKEAGVGQQHRYQWHKQQSTAIPSSAWVLATFARLRYLRSLFKRTCRPASFC